MKKIIAALLACFIILSCEETVMPDLESGPTRLVVDANMSWQLGTTGNEQVVLLTLSTEFFTDNPFIPVGNALVSVQNVNTNQQFDFVYQGDGEYFTDEFVPVLNDEYRITINYNGEIYSATEIMQQTPEIESIDQSIEGGFDSDAIEVNVRFLDDANQENFYLTEYFSTRAGFPDRNTFSDEFFNGNLITAFAETSSDFDDDQEELEPGDTVNIQLTAISEAFYDYFSLLLDQNESQGPFGTTPAPLRGNLINETNPENFPFGFFRCNQVERARYVVE